jgi:hypothetical protein
METFNRIVAIILWSLLLLTGLYLAVAPIHALQQGQALLGDLESVLVGWQADNSTNFILGQVAWGLGSILLFGTLLGAEILSGRRRGVRIRTPEGGLAEIETNSIGQRLEWHLDQLAEVVSVVPSVKSRGGSVDILLEVETAPDIDVPMKTDEVVNVTRDIVEQDMGLKIGKLDVRVRYAPYDPEWI